MNTADQSGLQFTKKLKNTDWLSKNNTEKKTLKKSEHWPVSVEQKRKLMAGKDTQKLKCLSYMVLCATSAVI
jgi:hypothetical protein